MIKRVIFFIGTIILISLLLIGLPFFLVGGIESFITKFQSPPVQAIETKCPQYTTFKLMGRTTIYIMGDGKSWHVEAEKIIEERELVVGGE